VNTLRTSLVVTLAAALFAATGLGARQAKATKPSPDPLAGLSAESKACVQCHQTSATPVVVQQWATSRHAKSSIGCYECHAADKTDKGAFEHHGVTISLFVTPRDCGQCHERETREFEASHHAAAGEILGSLDNVLGEVVEGAAASNSGCKQCHGGAVKLLADAKPDPATWPNEGIGRLNPDGSKGSC
jgi:hydroxylamine dehydrogenase